MQQVVTLPSVVLDLLSIDMVHSLLLESRLKFAVHTARNATFDPVQLWVVM